jgi:hypothetical protein
MFTRIILKQTDSDSGDEDVPHNTYIQNVHI